MDLPFATDAFLAVFREYNTAVWPTQIALLLLATWCIVLAFVGRAPESRLATGLLAALWLWMGVVYHAIYFAPINPAAMLFAVTFVLQATLFAFTGTMRGHVMLRFRLDARGVAGAAMILYALVVYPILGALSTHAYPSAPTFGLPCPTTIFTFGILLWTDPTPPRHLLVIPVLWAIVGTTASFTLGIAEDIGLGIAALVTVLVLALGESHRGETIARV